MERYFAAMSGVGYRLLRLLAIALELGDAEHFTPFFRDGVSVLRLLHYSDRVSSPDDGIYACGAHSDYGMLTLLLTDGTPGLQIREHDEWVNVESRPGELIVNLGDMLEVCIRMCYYCTARMCVRVRERETLIPLSFLLLLLFSPTIALVERIVQVDGPPRRVDEWPRAVQRPFLLRACV